MPVAFTCVILGDQRVVVLQGSGRRPSNCLGAGPRLTGRSRPSSGPTGTARLAAVDRGPAREGLDGDEKTVADSMRRHGLVARIIKRRRGLTNPAKGAATFPDLVRRDLATVPPSGAARTSLRASSSTPPAARRTPPTTSLSCAPRASGSASPQAGSGARSSTTPPVGTPVPR